MRLPVRQHNCFHVVRGDFVAGGAKKPALLKYLARQDAGCFAYAGSLLGSGGWAVAEACHDLRRPCLIFAGEFNYRPDWLERIRTLDYVTLHLLPPQPLSSLEQIIRRDHPQAHLLPAGFDDLLFINDLAGSMAATLSGTETNGEKPVRRLWVPVVSGVLARAACQAFPEAEIHAVTVAKHHGPIGRAIPYFAPEKFHQQALTPPPWPACPYSDAKLWQFVQKHGVSGDFIWNVAS